MPKLPDTRAPALRPRPAPARPATGSGVRWLLTASLIATLGACANYSGIDPSARAVDASPLGLDNTPQKYQGNDWWLALNDAQLTALIQQAIEHSPGLKATRARLALTESLLDQRKAQDGPQLGVELDLQRQLFTANSIYPPPFGGSIYEMGTLQLDASWELDFFGKNSAALAASLGQLRAVEADLQAARGLIAANVARSYYQLVRLQAQRKLAQQTLELREKMQKLVGQRVLAGLDTRLELVQSHGALPQVQLQIEQLDEQKALAMNALAALTAQPVQALALTIPDLADIAAPATPTTLPLNLLGTRADIAAARWRIEAATQDVKSAKAQFYPNINRTAYAGNSSIGFANLLQASSEQWGVGPALQLPLFDSGRLRAQLSGKTAELDSAIESYNGQVFEAVHQVSDQLASAQAIQRQQAQQDAAQKSALHAQQIAQQRFDAGLGTSLAVLGAQLPVLAQSGVQIDLAARALDARVQLLHAIGASFDASALPAQK